MKKWTKFLAAMGMATVAWGLYRNMKYPIQQEYRLLNRIIVPGQALNDKIASLSNACIDRMDKPPLPEGVLRKLLVIKEGGRRINLSLYMPEKAAGKLPCLVYCHGGGFVFETAFPFHRLAAEYARRGHCLVVMPDYRTSARHPFPAGFEDCYATLKWLWERGAFLNIDTNRMAVGGDSAGGALAAACALRARDENGPKLCFQMLIYPVLDVRMKTASMWHYSDSPLWNANLNRRMWEMYLKNGFQGMTAYASPALAEDLSGLPPAYIEAEEYDCLHDEAVAYANALQKAGVAVTLKDVAGSFHGFDSFWNKRLTRKMLDVRGRVLKAAFEKAQGTNL